MLILLLHLKLKIMAMVCEKCLVKMEKALSVCTYRKKHL